MKRLHRQLPCDPVAFFGDYMRLTGTPSLDPEPGKLAFAGKTLGLVNGSNWVSLWGTYFGRKLLPGAKLIHSGSDMVQLHFMAAHHAGRRCPPTVNVRMFVRSAQELVNLNGADAILVTCSTMNRAIKDIRHALARKRVPVIQIDEAMMEEAVNIGGRILVIATHGPTVKSTQNLLQETAERLGKSVDFEGATIERAFDLLGEGKIKEHNRLIADTIRRVQRTKKIDLVVLAQLSMSVFSFTHPDPIADFGVKVLNSAETGFRRVGELLAAKK